MGNLAEKEITSILQEYANSINTARTDMISSFYTEDGLFMPEGFKTLAKAQLLFKRSGNFFERKEFNITYAIENISIDTDYAFVAAAASTSTKDVVSDIVSEKKSQDFFVFRKEAGQWKIFRYMFNNLSTIAS
ncbi:MULTISPECIES: YybH family protein [Sphingobacterium]|uniref:YybH family protein n=1 Tax=Sphingobacterium TaxID=28453 RepID=UPI002580E82C|nr:MULTISPECIES: nuclear transport factor 2 family protein [Sphingobacterium]